MLQDEMKDIVKTLKHEANRAVSYHGWPEDLARREYNKKVNLSKLKQIQLSIDIVIILTLTTINLVVPQKLLKV